MTEKDFDIEDIAAKTMHGDMMNHMIEMAKALPKPWQQMSEDEQDDWIASIESRCKHIIEQTVSIIASEGFASIDALLAQVVFKDGVKAQLEIPRGAQHAIDLAEAQGKSVRLVCWSALKTF